MTSSSTAVRPVNFVFGIGVAPIYCQFHPTLEDLVNPPFGHDVSNAAFVQFCKRSRADMKGYSLRRDFKQHIVICNDGYKLWKENGEKDFSYTFQYSPIPEVAAIICISDFLHTKPKTQHLSQLTGELYEGLILVVGKPMGVTLGEAGNLSRFWTVFSSPQTVVNSLDFVPVPQEYWIARTGN